MTATRLFACALLLPLLWSSVARAEYNPETYSLSNGAESRTAGRAVAADPHPYPGWMMNRPGYYEFTPMVSNHDAVHDMRGEYDGQDWDTSKWPANWTADKALNKFYDAGIFTHQSLHGPGARTVDLGPTFYKLSVLDQNRMLKLLTDADGTFASDTSPVILRDHATRKMVGSYAPTGLQMN